MQKKLTTVFNSMLINFLLTFDQSNTLAFSELTWQLWTFSCSPPKVGFDALLEAASASVRGPLTTFDDWSQKILSTNSLDTNNSPKWHKFWLNLWRRTDVRLKNIFSLSFSVNDINIGLIENPWLSGEFGCLQRKRTWVQSKFFSECFFLSLGMSEVVGKS